MSAIEDGDFSEPELAMLRKQWQSPASQPPVIGITGTGGAGKSSVTDELLNRFLASFPQMRIAVISVDPTRRRTRSEEHTSELQSLMRISYAVFCLQKKQ